MAPDFQNGDIALTFTLYPQKLLKNDRIILFNHAEYGVMIKRILSIDRRNKHITVGGNKLSTSTQDIGDIPFGDIIGVVFWRVKKK